MEREADRRYGKWVVLLLFLAAGGIFLFLGAALPAISTTLPPISAQTADFSTPGITNPAHTPEYTPTLHKPTLTPTPTPTLTPTPNAPTPSREPTELPYYIEVNRSPEGQLVRIFGKDSQGEYTRVVKEFICSTGLELEDTPAGTFTINAKYRWLSLSGNVWGQYSVRFNGSILFHSVYYYERTPDTLSTEAFNLLGSPASAGCVRLCVADVKWIYDNCAIGTRVRVFDGPDESALRAQLKLAPVYPGANGEAWDPTDPSKPRITPPPVTPTPAPTEIPTATPGPTPTETASTPPLPTFPPKPTPVIPTETP